MISILSLLLLSRGFTLPNHYSLHKAFKPQILSSLNFQTLMQLFENVPFISDAELILLLLCNSLCAVDAMANLATMKWCKCRSLNSDSEPDDGISLSTAIEVAVSQQALKLLHELLNSRNTIYIPQLFFKNDSRYIVTRPYLQTSSHSQPTGEGQGNTPRKS